VNEWVDERLEMITPVRSLFPAQEDATSAILCIPASDRADEIIAKLFEASLIERKVSAKIIGPQDAVHLAWEGFTPRAVVISALPPEAVSAARTVCKRIRKNNGEVTVIVGLWCAAGDLDRSRQRLAAAGATRTVSSFAECFALLEAPADGDAPARVEAVPELGTVSEA
jgi:hypothetical protein